MKRWLPEAFAVFAILAVVSYGFAQTWTMSTPQVGVMYPGCAAMSADGMKIMVCGSSFGGGGIMAVSTNYGTAWTNIPYSATLQYTWYHLASSADVTKLLAARVSVAGPIYVSTNSGNSWYPTFSPATNWSALASSADGTKFYAVVNGGAIYCSTNSGMSWQSNNSPSNSWTSIAVSADGTKVYAASTNLIYGSTNSGRTWVPLSAPSIGWKSICSSADGTFLAAAGNFCYTSTNSGTSWTPTGQSFYLVASSADGSKLIASTGIGYNVNGYIYLSTDYGNTWVSNSPPYNPWGYVGCSADGNQFVAIVGSYYSAAYCWTLKNTPAPQLNVNASTNNCLLSWLVPSTNFVVQQSPDLISWSSFTNAPSLNPTNLNNELTISPSNSSGFFRLISQ